MKPELISLLLKKPFWTKYNSHISRDMFADHALLIFDSISNYHGLYTDDLDKSKLWELIKSNNPTLTSANKTFVYELIEDIKDASDWTEDFAKDILSDVWKKHIFTKIAELGIKGSQGLIKDVSELRDLIEKSEAGFLLEDDFPECDLDIDDLEEQDKASKWWKFNIPVFQENVGSMYGGLFLQAMGRPDAGKTALLISLIAGPGGWLDQGATVDWYSNEEPIKRTRWRCMSAHSGLTKAKMLQAKDVVRQDWATIKDNLHMFDVPAGMPIEKLAERTKQRKPNILIADQVDKFSVVGNTREFAGEHERIRSLYIKYREIAKANDTLVVGICQASAAAEGHRIVTYDQAENSKTGKGAECDLFIGIGKDPLRNEDLKHAEEDTTESNDRYLTVSKNKLESGWKGVVNSRLVPTLSRYVGYND